MAIKIGSSTVISNNRRADLGMVNFGSYTSTELNNKDVVGTQVGDFTFNKTTGQLSYWNGSAWTNT